MGRKKEVVVRNGKYVGKYLDEQICKRLDTLINLNDRNGYIEDLKNIIYDLTPEEVELIKVSKANDFVDIKNSQGELTNLQTIGVAYMYYAKRLVLGDSVGLGKTVEVAGLCNLLESDLAKSQQEFRFLFLTGKSYLAEIQNKLIKFTGNYVEKVYGEKDKVKKFVDSNKEDIQFSVVGAHSLLKSVEFQEYFRFFLDSYGYNPFDILIIDESGDVLTNSTTQYYKNALFFAGLFDRVILLNATPFEKDLRMFYNQIAYVDDSLLPTKTAFGKEYEIMSYTGAYPQFSGKYRNQDKFRNLVGYRYFARTRKGSGAEMKNCTADVIVSSLTQEQRELLKKTSMPYMVYECPSYFNMGIETNIQTTPKLATLLNLMNTKLAEADSVLIYSRYKESQRIIQEMLVEYGFTAEVMNGETTVEEREAISNRFRLGDTQVLITNVQKGLDFDHCNNCVFYTYDPNPNKMVQLEGRTTRSFNIENKHIWAIVSRGDELRNFKKVVAERAQASDAFAGSDFSCILSILLDEKKLKELK